MNLNQPISPDEASSKDRVITSVPGEVFAVFNEFLIARYKKGGTVIIRQDEVMRALLTRLAPITRQEIYDRQWLDIEGAYERYGWKVTYDKPGFNESGEALFMFSPG